MKIEETRIHSAGFAGAHKQKRVRALAKNEAIPEGANEVPEETPETDWQIAEEGE